MKILPLDIMRRMEKRLVRLYGEGLAPRLMARLELLAGRYAIEGLHRSDSVPIWNQRDALLISYGDMVQTDEEKPLHTLARFLSERMNDAFSMVHLLPFFVSAADQDCAIIDHKRVSPALGQWHDVETLAREHKLMFSLILNHVSKRNEWFTDYVNGIAPARKYFISIDADSDLGAVVRPCCHPVLVHTPTRRGTRHLWSTYANDQFDLNFANPDVLFEFFDIVLFYVARGARIIGINDAAYLWKCPGTDCVNRPETHELIRLLRDLLKLLAPDALLLTETNLPHRENVSYFGAGDEAHLIQQYSLPPLLLHALHTGSAKYLAAWASTILAPPEDCTFLNFTGHAGGIGLRPLEGLMPELEVHTLVQTLKQRGADIRMHVNTERQQHPYEANITYFEALSDSEHSVTDLHIRRFLCAQTIMLAFKGIPAVYFNDLTAIRHEHEPARTGGESQGVNHRRWDKPALIQLLDNPDSLTGTIFRESLRRMGLRQSHPAFHPDGAQFVLALDDGLFGIQRRAPDESETLFCISNLTAQQQPVAVRRLTEGVFQSSHPFDLIGGRPLQTSDNGTLWLDAYQTVWVAACDGNPAQE